LVIFDGLLDDIGQTGHLHTLPHRRGPLESEEVVCEFLIAQMPVISQFLEFASDGDTTEVLAERVLRQCYPGTRQTVPLVARDKANGNRRELFGEMVLDRT